MLIVRRASVSDLDTLVPLFDAYRQFYRQPEDLEGARGFLKTGMEQDESIVFLAFNGAHAIAFAAAEFARSSGAMRLVLSTEAGNSTAQCLYEKRGWKRDRAFWTHQLRLI